MNPNPPSSFLPNLPVPQLAKGRRAFLSRPWLWFSLIVLAVLVWLWSESRAQIQSARQEVALRLAESERVFRDEQTKFEKASNELEELKQGQSALETRLGEMEAQAASLQQLYQEVAASRDDALLTEVEQNIQVAQQYLQLTGNVEAAILALQTANSRLQRAEARFLPLRRALTNDLEKLRTTPFVDIAGMSLRLETVISGIDRLPLAFDALKDAAQKDANAEEMNADSSVLKKNDWRELLAEVWRDIRGLARIQRLDRQVPELISPEHGLILRENIKLRLLNARLALLMRDSWTFKNELAVVENRLETYFNPDAKATQAARATLSQLASANINVAIPVLSESPAVVRQLKNRRQ